MSPDRDLTIESALADPMIRAAMKADHVNPREFEALLRGTARQLDAMRPRQQPVIAATYVAKGCARDWMACLA